MRRAASCSPAIASRLFAIADSFIEDGLYANCLEDGLPADGVVTGMAKIAGRPIALMANDSTVKAGSWGARTVEKIVRIQEVAARHELPLFYLVDSAGARLTDQVEMFPGRRGAGKIFFRKWGSQEGCRRSVFSSGLRPREALIFPRSATSSFSSRGTQACISALRGWRRP